MSHANFPRSASDPAPTYTIVRLPDVDGVLGIFSVVKSAPANAYTVVVTEAGVTCSCLDYWKWGVDKKVPQYACKHIKMVAEHVTSQTQPSEGSKPKAVNRKEKTSGSK